MKRIRRYIFNTLTAVSVLLLLGTVGFWVRSLIATTYLEIPSGSFGPESFTVSVSLETKDVDLWLSIQRYPGDTSLFWSPEVPATYRSLIGFTYLTGKGQGRHRYTSLEIPSWFLMLIFATAPAVWLYKWRKRCKLGPNACSGCGYDLTGNETGECPECGVGIMRT